MSKNEKLLAKLLKPHPGNELKHYIRRQIIEQLKSGDLIQ